ncbi:hypothetical protein [Nocardia sp. NPDC060249]|uniref:hypothetical protein n=1 Tax=Nocardia sp. NPDC060249 TaxID=3347082 RepID=UPI00364D9ECC
MSTESQPDVATMQRIQGRDLSPANVGQYMIRAKNGYHQPGEILDIVPIRADRGGAWLLTVKWVATPVDAAQISQAKVAFDGPAALIEAPLVRAVPGTAAAQLELGEIPEDQAVVEETGAVVSDWIKLVQSGPYVDGMTETTTVRARDLTPRHVGKVFGNGDESGLTYFIKVLNFRAIEDGPKPGVQLWLRHSQIETRPAYDNEWHVPFDREFKFVELTPFKG